MTSIVSVPFAAHVEDTLGAVEGYPEPVVRSCHLGNNGAYNWGWLALARNTRLVLFDHTTYSADRICVPPAVLGDHGAIEAFYDIDGHEMLGLRGAHVNVATRAFQPKHRNILNLGLPATHAGLPLATFHFETNRRTAARFGSATPSYDAREIGENLELFSQIVQSAFASRSLPLVFDRYVETRRRRVVISPIVGFEYSHGDVTAFAADDRVLFVGSARELVEVMRSAVAQIQRCVERGHRLSEVAYPWLSVTFAYAFGAAIEYSRHPDLRRFLHAGGLASPYYTRGRDFGLQLSRLHRLLAAGGFLPQAFAFELIPIGGCQLFGRTADGAAVLSELLDIWRDLLAKLPDRTATLAELAERPHPYDRAFAAASAQLGPAALERLDAALQDANSAGVALPICFTADESPPPTFNKYGLGSEAFDGASHFPAGLASMTWVELEWLTHVLASLAADRDELAAKRSERPVGVDV